MEQKGLDVARKILDINRLGGQVEIVIGEEEDYFDPSINRISLNKKNQNKKNISIAIAIHEVGHALQLNTNWKVYNLRCKLIVIKFPLIYITALFIGLGFWKETFWMFAIASLISLIVCTVLELIVEINASVRGWRCYKEYFETNKEELLIIGIALGVAAFTYFIDIFASVFKIIRLLLHDKEKNQEGRWE